MLLDSLELIQSDGKYDPPILKMDIQVRNLVGFLGGGWGSSVPIDKVYIDGPCELLIKEIDR